jgi:hypothetical protein
MTPRKKAPIEEAGGGSVFPRAVEKAVAILEDLPAPAWARITELTAANLRGHLSYEAWRAACGALIERTARDDGGRA